MGKKKSLSGPVAAHEVPELLRLDPGERLTDVDPSGTPGFEGGGKADGELALAAGAEAVSALQERLWAEGTAGGSRSVLLVVQGLDTSGKGGIMRHVVGSVDPQGVRHTAFKAPSEIERGHDFLWRIKRALPHPGEIGVFDRSHYEDVLVVRVDELVPEAKWRPRYDAINRFEAGLTASGTTIVKVMLHISREEQKERLAKRLSRPDKYWKYNPGDVDVRLKWVEYMTAYQEALTRCQVAGAPWYVVPADHKWYARWAVQQLLATHLEALEPRWPQPEFDLKVERQRLADS